jgi:hypothetical protein
VPASLRARRVVVWATTAPILRPYDPRAPRNRLCQVCRHPERTRMESLMASRESVARKFGIEPHAMWRHMRNHVHPDELEMLKGTPATLAHLAEKAAAENMSILDYLTILRSRLMRQLEASAAAGDNPGVCAAPNGG